MKEKIKSIVCDIKKWQDLSVYKDKFEKKGISIIEMSSEKTENKNLFEIFLSVEKTNNKGNDYYIVFIEGDLDNKNEFNYITIYEKEKEFSC